MTVVEREGLRHAVTDGLLANHRRLLGLLADASALVPIGLIVKISKDIFGPRLSALVSGFLSPNRAASLIGKIPLDLLVEQTPHLDERIVPTLVEKVDVSVHRALCAALAKDRDYATLVAVLCAVPTTMLAVTLSDLADSDVLAVAAVAVSPHDRTRILESRLDAAGGPQPRCSDPATVADAATRLVSALPGLDIETAGAAINALLVPATN
ncbi:hypothetical protein OF855_01165 [Mycolicibacterium fortuitum]|uniref:hypothetical protein n=1 Tax=Mycolicibacterium fortuitum TaxID=1766 RepID=UPI0022BA5256|nr:hypothetical protein [Mycolicibacterium fortuitum]WAY19776.1 hypothetical protein OF855_01165 [Mycolicibacterium fortuitum]